MPIRYGKPYDPKLRKTELGSRLYEIWRRMRQHPHCEEWDYFPTFYEWAMQTSYTMGLWLRIIDDSGIYSPENCEWYVTENKADRVNAEWINSWNKTVNRIRKHYGMPPLEGTNYNDL